MHLHDLVEKAEDHIHNLVTGFSTEGWEEKAKTSLRMAREFYKALSSDGGRSLQAKLDADLDHARAVLKRLEGTIDAVQEFVDAQPPRKTPAKKT